MTINVTNTKLLTESTPTRIDITQLLTGTKTAVSTSRSAQALKEHKMYTINLNLKTKRYDVINQHSGAVQSSWTQLTLARQAARFLNDYRRFITYRERGV